MSLKGLLVLAVIAISIPNQTEASFFFNWRSQSNSNVEETNSNVVPVITTTTTSNASPATSWFGSWWRTNTIPNAPPPPISSDESEAIQTQTEQAPPRRKKNRRHRKTPAHTGEEEVEVIAAIKSANYNPHRSAPPRMLKLRQSPDEGNSLVKIIQDYALTDAVDESTE